MTVSPMKAAPGWLLPLLCLLGGGQFLLAADSNSSCRPGRVDHRGRQRIGLTWGQKVQPGFQIALETLRVASDSISARVMGPGETCDLTMTLSGKAATSFDLTIEIPERRYTTRPAYPFRFMAPEKGWSYVQNKSGEGMLMPMEQSDRISKPFGWSRSQPSWGLTDLQRGLSVRLDSFRNPDGQPGPRDATVYAVPLRITMPFSARAATLRRPAGLFSSFTPGLAAITRAGFQAAGSRKLERQRLRLSLGLQSRGRLETRSEMKAAGWIEGSRFLWQTSD